MTLDASQVRVASNGYIRVAPINTAAPATVLTTPDPAWLDLGYAGEDGVTLARSITTEDIMGWQSSTPLRRIVTASILEVKFTLMQSNIDTMALYFNATINGADLDLPIDPVAVEKALLVEWLDGTEEYRLYMGRAQLGEVGDASLTRGDAVKYEMTFTALAPSTGTNAAKLYMPAA